MKEKDKTTFYNILNKIADNYFINGKPVENCDIEEEIFNSFLKNYNNVYKLNNNQLDIIKNDIIHDIYMISDVVSIMIYI